MRLLIILSIFLPLTINLDSKSHDSSYNYVHIVDYANPTPLQEIQSRYSAYDFTDGDISKSLEFITEYDEKDCKLGYYDLIISVMNTKLNTTIRTDKIYVKDFIAPKIEIRQKDLLLDISNGIDKEDLLKCITITDNLDTTFDNVIIENFESLKNPGTYDIKIYAIDSSQNKSNVISLTIRVTQSIKTYLLNDSIEITNKVLSKEEILSWFLNHEGITITENSYFLESNYFSNSNHNGIYQVMLKVINEDDTCQIYMSKINVRLKKDESKEKNTVTYIGVGTIGILIILGVIIYKKRC